MGKVLYPTKNNPKGDLLEYNDKYSFKDYTMGHLLGAKDLEGVTIYASCFSKEIPDSKVFPDSVNNLTLVNCNLDNVYIKAGWTVTGGSQRRFKVQSDAQDWIIDKDNKPIKMISDIVIF